MKITVAVNYHEFTEKGKTERQDAALSVLVRNKPENVDLISCNYEKEMVNVPDGIEVVRELRRNSRQYVHNNRDLPYIKDIFNICAERDCEVFGYINSDILLLPEFYDAFVPNKDVFLFNRIDIEPTAGPMFLPNNIKTSNKSHPGLDGVFFNRKWWIENRPRFHDDLIVGEPEWDFYYDRIINESTGEIVKARSLYHVHHDTTWTITSNGAKNNRKINGTIT